MSSISRFLTLSAISFALTGALHAQVVGTNGDPNPSYSGLWAWYDAAAGINGSASSPGDGTPVSAWHDSGSAGHDLLRTTSGDEPTFRSAAANGLPALEFDGSRYIWGDSSGQFGTINGPKTIFIAGMVAAADGGYVFDGTSSSGRNAFFTGQTSAPATWQLYTGSSIVSGPSVGTGVVQVHTTVFDHGYQEQFLNGSSVAQGSGSLDPMKGFMLGSRYSVSNFLDGLVAEVLVYDEILSPADRQAIEAYLIAKHPITQPPPTPAYTDVFWNNDGNYPVYRIPAITRTSDGTLLAFAEGRQSLNDHSQNDIVLKRSTDDGDTWEPLQVLWNPGIDNLNNPCVVQLDSIFPGRILLMFQKYPFGCHSNCVVPGYTGNVCRSYIMWSDDDGLTWTAPLEISTQVKRPTSNSVSSGPGNAIQKRHFPYAGRVIFPFNHHGSNGWKVYAVYSDDGGQSWDWGNFGNDSQLGGIDPNEVQIAELSDGRLQLNARSTGGSYRIVAESSDGGINWSPLRQETQLIEPHCMASILQYTDPADGYGSPRMLYAGPNRTGSRSHGTVWVSKDDGVTWSDSREVYSGGYAYSALALLDKPEMGVLFEKDGYSSITFAKFSLDWLTEGADSLLQALSYESGTPGTNGIVPQLEIQGSTTNGNQMDVVVTFGRIGANGWILAGAQRENLAAVGCTLLVSQPFLVQVPINLTIIGTSTTSYQIPPTMLGRDVRLQVFIADSGGPAGYSSTAGREVHFY